MSALLPAGPFHHSKALISAALQPVIGRPLARPAVGSRFAVAGLRRPWPCPVYDVFWLLSSGF
jgi:hypothetical protein